MPQKVWGTGEEVLAADFNTYAQNQVVPQFTTTAQRDTQWAAAPNGAFCVTVDTGTLWQRIGATWYTPQQRLATVARTTDFGWTGTADALIVQVTVTVPAGRKIRVEAMFAGGNSANVNDRAYIKIKESATVLSTYHMNTNANFQSNGGSWFVTVAPAAGPHTYGVYAAGNAATNYNLQCGILNPLQLEVFDVGTT
jgi:hypothetical protein